jgi:hypothetical protein
VSWATVEVTVQTFCSSPLIEEQLPIAPKASGRPQPPESVFGELPVDFSPSLFFVGRLVASAVGVFAGATVVGLDVGVGLGVGVADGPAGACDGTAVVVGGVDGAGDGAAVAGTGPARTLAVAAATPAATDSRANPLRRRLGRVVLTINSPVNLPRDLRRRGDDSTMVDR